MLTEQLRLINSMTGDFQGDTSRVAFAKTCYTKAKINYEFLQRNNSHKITLMCNPVHENDLPKPMNELIILIHRFAIRCRGAD